MGAGIARPAGCNHQRRTEVVFSRGRRARLPVGFFAGSNSEVSRQTFAPPLTGRERRREETRRRAECGVDGQWVHLRRVSKATQRLHFLNSVDGVASWERSTPHGSSVPQRATSQGAPAGAGAHRCARRTRGWMMRNAQPFMRRFEFQPRRATGTAISQSAACRSLFSRSWRRWPAERDRPIAIPPTC